MNASSLLLILLLPLFIISCDKDPETLDKGALNEYYPVTRGKYITYRVDSTVFTNFGRNTEIHYYRVKHVIDTIVTDNLGRQGYRVYRYITDSAGTQPWTPNGSYVVVPLTYTIEVIEDNLRVIKLNWPMQDGITWKGNRYLPTDPYGTYYSFSNDDNMADWDFYYDGNAEPSVTLMGQTYNDVFTVQQDDEAYNFPITDPGAYAARSYSVEKYARDIGLVYRELILWEQQPYPPPPFRIGFAIKMWMIDHN